MPTKTEVLCEQCEEIAYEPLVLRTGMYSDTLCENCFKEAIFDVLLMDGELLARVISEDPTTIQLEIRRNDEA